MVSSSPRALSVVLVLLVLSVSGCRRRPRNADEGPWPVVTLTNLHPDEAHARLYSVNYQRPALIPVCTPMQIERVTDREALVTHVPSGRQYTYVFHRSMSETIQEHLDLYFGQSCPQQVIATLGPVDQQGLRDGRVYPGMTKQGVILAIGYPPLHATPTLEQDVWKYWSSRMGTFEVIFAGGFVQTVRQ